MKTICLFAGYDKEGVIDDYVIYYIKSLSQFSDVYYCGDFNPKNGELEKIKEITKDAIAFRHKKYDYGSWNELIQKIGWKNIQKYDQLILANDSCYGPLFSLDEVFSVMNEKKCDFWGLSCGKGYHIHIQSYFLVFRKKVLESDCIPFFLSEVKEQPSLKEVCEYYEDQFTFFLKKKGFTYNTYIPYGEFKLHPYYETWKCIKNKRFPFLKVKVFNGEVGYDKVNNWKKFIKNYTEYDSNLISNNLYRRGYKEKDINLAVHHWEKSDFIKKGLIKIKVFPKKTLKKIINPIWVRFMFRLDKRFLENRFLLEKNMRDLKKQINNLERKVDFNSHYSDETKVEIYDFFKKYQLFPDLKLSLKIHKKNIQLDEKKELLSNDSIIESFNISDFMRIFKNIPMYQKCEKISILLCGDMEEEMILEYILKGSYITSLNNNCLRKNTIEYELIRDSVYKTNLLSDFCFYQEKDIYFFDLILVNKLKENISEGELLALLYNFSKNMFDESILIISIPHEAEVMNNFDKILEEVDLEWNSEYQELLEGCFADMNNSNCLVLMKNNEEEL